MAGRCDAEAHTLDTQVGNRQDVSILEATQKVVIFGGGSFGTAVGAALARQKADLDVTMLLRDPYVCQDINTLHRNRRYLDVRLLSSTDLPRLAA